MRVSGIVRASFWPREDERRRNRRPVQPDPRLLVGTLAAWDKALVPSAAGREQIASPLSSLFQPGDKYVERPDLRLLAALIGCETPTKRRHPRKIRRAAGSSLRNSAISSISGAQR